MASRSIHNAFTKRILKNISLSEINRVNKEIDAPVKTLGPYHRMLYHDINPTSPDSLLINKGDMNREMIRQLHIWLDEHKEFSESLELIDILKRMRKRRK